MVASKLSFALLLAAVSTSGVFGAPIPESRYVQLSLLYIVSHFVLTCYLLQK